MCECFLVPEQRKSIQNIYISCLDRRTYLLFNGVYTINWIYLYKKLSLNDHKFDLRLGKFSTIRETISNKDLHLV